MIRFSLLSTLAILLFAIPSKADNVNETTLRLDLKKGARYEIITSTKIDYFTDASLSEKVVGMNWNIKVSMEVIDKTEEGIHTIKTEITNINANQSMGEMSLSYDSDDTSTADPMVAILAKQFEPLINSPVTITVNALGEVMEVSGDEQQGGAVSLSNIAQGFFMELPKEPLKEGDKWQQEQSIEMSGDTRINMSYSATKVSSNKVELTYEADEKSIVADAEAMDDFKIKMKGTSVFDKKTGMMMAGTNNTSMKGSDPQMGEFFMVTSTEQKAELK